MAIRKNTNPQEVDLQPEMRDMLMRNGMQAHVVSDGGGYQLVVQGHDSPLLTYNISEQQMLALTDWGTNYANKKAYNTFTAIVGNDFYMPKNFVHARNANGRVAMGLHGYRVGAGEYGRMGAPRSGNPLFLGWTPRSQEGFHLRRVDGRLFFPEAPIVAERWNGRMNRWNSESKGELAQPLPSRDRGRALLKPGEMQSGGYGFYYKGQQQTAQRDVLQDLQSVITPIETRPRSAEPAKPYKELITSPVYFSNEKWQECLSSHGIIVDAEAKKLTIQSKGANADMVYDLTDEEVKALTSNSIKEVPIAKRLEVLNGVIKDDFADKITMEMLNSKDRIDIKLQPNLEQELQREQQVINPLEEQNVSVKQEMQQHGNASVNGQDVGLHNENKGWYREGAHGREVEVGEIFVEKKPPLTPPVGGNPKAEATYRMTAIINGEAISHEISQKQYDKFMAVDDYHRMKLFSKVFDEVDMKTRPEANRGLGTKILAALTAGAVVTSEVMHDMRHDHPMPEVYEERFGGPARPYFKPGVDSPQDVAARNFEAEMNRGGTVFQLGI